MQTFIWGIIQGDNPNNLWISKTITPDTMGKVPTGKRFQTFRCASIFSFHVSNQKNVAEETPEILAYEFMKQVPM